jgi:hypothetical protein
MTMEVETGDMQPKAEEGLQPTEAVTGKNQIPYSIRGSLPWGYQTSSLLGSRAMRANSICSEMSSSG